MKLKIPFLTSSLESDIIWVWLLLPLWYIIGIDKLIWLPFAFFITVKILILKINKRPFFIPNEIFFKALLLFFIVYIASAVLVFFNKNYFLYIKTLFSYYTGFIFIISIMNFKKREETLKLIKIFCFIGIISVIINLLAITGIFQYDFTGLASRIIPGKFLNSQFISSNLHKNPFEEDALTYNVKSFIFQRPKSLFTSANFFSGFLLITIFSLLYLFLTTKKGINKFFLLVMLLLSLMSLLTTLSRSALLGLTGSMTLLLYKRKIHRTLKVLIILCLIIFLYFINHFMGIYETIMQRGVVRRWIIYKESFNEIFKYPIFGHGAPLSFSEIHNIDLGSHGTIINIAFSHGLFGLILYLVMIGYIFFSSWRLLRLNLRREDKILMEMLFYSFIAVSIHCLFITWHFGTIYFMAIWTLWGIILKNVSCYNHEINHAKAKT